MADFKSTLTLDGSSFNQTLDNAGKSVQDFQKSTEDASKSVDEMGKTSKRTASELLKEMKNMEGLGRSTSNYRQQLGQVQRQIVDLTMNYRAMSDEMKNSDFGREVASQIDELTQKASEMKDTIMDASSSVKLLASDTANLDAAKMGIEGLSAGLQLVASAGILGADSTEKLVKVIARLKAIEAVTNGVIKIANILNENSIFMLKMKQLATRANTAALNENTAAQIANNAAATAGTAAQGANTAATTANNTAQTLLGGKISTITKGFRGLISTLGKSRIATLGVVGAVIALIAAYVKLSNRLREEHQEQMRNIRLTDEMRDAWSDATKEISSSVGKVAAQFHKLQKAWEGLNTDEAKIEYLKKYGKELEQLGIKAQSINDLEDIWSEEGTKKIRKAVMLRAQYLAIQGLAMKKYQEAFDKMSQNMINRDSANYSAGQIYGQSQSNPQGFVAPQQLELRGLVEGIDYEVIERDIYGNIKAKILEAGATKLRNDAIDMGTEFGIQYGEAAAKPFEDMLDGLRRYAQQNGIDLFEDSGGGGGSGAPQKDPFEVGSAAYYSKLISEINNKLQNQVNTKEQILEYERQIQMLEGLRARALGQEPGNLIPQLPMRSGISEPVIVPAKLDFSQYEIEFPDITFNDLNNEISNAIGGLQSMNSAVANVGKSIEDLGSGWDDSKSALENITTKVADVFSIMQSVCTVIDTMNKLATIFESIENVSWMLQKKKNTEETKGLAIKAAGVVLSEEQATANAVGAAGSVAESAGKIPYVGWILAIAAVAGIIAAIASAKSSIGFAKGGIVPGSSFSGDNITAQVNSGEMILNTSQQAKLFDLLNGSGSLKASSNKVEFVIKGQELKGVLNNYDKKMSRV